MAYLIYPEAGCEECGKTLTDWEISELDVYLGQQIISAYCSDCDWNSYQIAQMVGLSERDFCKFEEEFSR